MFENILVLTSVTDWLKYVLMGTTNRTPWIFPDFESNYNTNFLDSQQNSLTFPLFWERLEFPWHFPDRGNPELIIHAEIKLKPC